MSNYRELLRNIFSSQFSAAIMTVASLAVLVVLTRLTEVSVFGQYSIIVGTVAMFTKFAGLNTYFYYRNRYPLASYPEALSILRQYLPAVILCGILVAFVVVFINTITSPFLPLQTALDYVLWVALVVLSLLNFEVVRFYQSIGRNIFGIWLTTIAKLACLLLAALVVLLFSMRLELRTIVLILVGAQMVAILFQVFLDRKFLEIFRLAAPGFDWRAVSAGIFILPTALFYDALSLFDRLALSSFLDYETVGHYSLASQGVLIAYSILGGTLITLFYPKLVRSRNDGAPGQTRQMLRLALLSGVGACLAGAAAILFLADLVPLIFDSRYAESAGILRMMCLVPLAMFLLSALAHLAYLLDDLKWSVAAFSFGIVGCIGLNYGLVGQYGVPGAVGALYTSLLVMIGLHLAIVLRKSSAVHREQIL